MAKFRPCIDLHHGQVKQIVGGTLCEDEASLVENFVSPRPAAEFAKNFQRDGLCGGHIIKLGPGNDAAALAALAAWRGGMQIGGGISSSNAAQWLAAGASHVIVTSALFSQDGKFLPYELTKLAGVTGAAQLVVDLSCRKTTLGWTIAMNRWQTLTNLEVTYETLDALAPFCSEFLIHAADVEGLCGGIDAELVEYLGNWGKIPMTYAGGAATMADVELIKTLGNGRIDFTVGSALDIFGGQGIRYNDLVTWNQSQKAG